MRQVPQVHRNGLPGYLVPTPLAVASAVIERVVPAIAGTTYEKDEAVPNSVPRDIVPVVGKANVRRFVLRTREEGTVMVPEIF